MMDMKRLLIVVLALFAGAMPVVLAASSTDAKTTTSTTTSTIVPKIGGTAVLGATTSPVVPPVCPKDVKPKYCYIILERATGLETVRDSVAYPTTVHASGTIVAFTVGVAKLANTAAATHAIIHGLDTMYGGTTQVMLSVLKPARGKNSNRIWTVAAQTQAFHLQPYLGYTVQFPLSTPLPVSPGEVVALTVPTWAPVLSFNLPSKKFAYRQSRRENCQHSGNEQNAQLVVGGSASYICDYPGARVEYTATELIAAPPPKQYVHGPNDGTAAGSGKGVVVALPAAQ
jgi:hypothetical protein